ncbi:MAG: NADH:ubiquinone oxidoreductase subunit NDUFA12 [Alphaproteobacteria bacterium]|nr:NADH:ubiquinone oxidoreductase subunit NDUFA12 [Alphaproteobacteria bacterium]
MLAIHLLTWFKGKFVGKDSYGNCYYTERFLIRSKDSKTPRRWVMFKGLAEGSKIPGEWHGWLHHTTEQTPLEKNNTVYKWQKPYSPNLTGTPHAYNPDSSHKKLDLDKTSFKHYTPWNPT